MEAEEKRVADEEEEEEGEALKSSLDPHLLNMLLLEAFPDAGDDFASIEDCLILEAPEEFRSCSSGAERHRQPPAEADRDQENAPEAADTDATAGEEVDTADREKVADEEKKGEEGGVDQYAGHEESRENEQTANVEESEKKGEHVGFGTTPVVCGDNTPCDEEEVVVECTDPGGMRDAVEESDARRPSIRAAAVADCASAPSQGCSRVSDAPDCAAPREGTPIQSRDSPEIALGDSESVGNSESGTTPAILQVIGQLGLHAEHVPSDLSLEFAATRRDLSILKAETESLDRAVKTETDSSDLLSSKDLNKRTVESRLKHLEEKLKRAGITDESCRVISSDSDSGFAKYNRFRDKKQVVDKSVDYCDANQNCIVKCEFDAANISKYAESGFGDGGYFLVYDELEDDCDCEDAVVGLTDTMRGEGAMGTDGERKQHNPDRDNLKSLLKKPNRAKQQDKKNRVVFNENRNEFFDADYIILIREDCDYDEDDDDGICTCNQHEMVRLTCCEPNCNCNVYDGYDQTPQSPKFAPPIEFVDAVTLSPPEGYKDMELGEQQLLALQQMARRGQMAAVCRECSQTHDDDGEGSEEEEVASDQDVETEKTDQSQQTTPTTPPPTETEDPNGQRGAPEAVVMATSVGGGGDGDERRPEEERLESPIPSLPPGGSPISGILKGGRLWKQQSVDIAPPQTEPQQVNGFNNNNRAQNVCSLGVFQVAEPVTSDDEGGSKRSVRFIEEESGKRESRDSCDGAPEKPHLEAPADERKEISPSPEPMEMMLTFKLGNHVLISNNSLKPNSAVRQLFPCTKPLAKPEDDSQQYLVTSESLRAFEEAKRSKLPQIIPGESDESIKRAIERNTLRRSLIRYEPRSKKAQQKTDNSLVERIKQLTCDVDDPVEEEQSRASPPGEEARNSPEVTAAKSFSPSSSSSSNSSVSSTYKKITDLFAKKDRPDIQVVEPVKTHAPDLGGPQEETPAMQKATPNPSNEPRKQFLSTLAPLTACVSGTIHPDDYYYHTSTQAAGDRMSMASSVGTEYSLEDIEEGLRKDEEESKRIAPDVLAGTPSASESGDELAMFVQQDASRIERIKKKYQQDDEDDEHDDYGFNRRPSVRGIKPRFGSTTEILQQIQNQMQPPPNSTPPRTSAPPVAWPYYSETNLSGVGVDNKRNINQQPPNYQYAQQYRPTTLIDENVYQNCANQRCAQVTYRSNVNIYSSPIMRVGGGCTDYYQSLPRARSGRPQSPPPQEVSKGFHQTMMYIPYNHIEGYQPVPAQYYDPGYVRVTNQNQINKRYTDPAYQEYAQKPVRAPYHIGRSESPLPGHFSTARSTQTPAPTLSTCTYYPRYRQPPPNGVIWSDAYGTKANRHSFPQPRYPNPDNISLTDSDSHSSGQLHNGFKDSMPNSPTKPRFIERGVPEGAASVSPQDCTAAQSASTMTSPTSPQNPQTNSKPLFYAMNV